MWVCPVAGRAGGGPAGGQGRRAGCAARWIRRKPLVCREMRETAVWLPRMTTSRMDRRTQRVPRPVLPLVVVVGAGGFAEDVIHHFGGAGRIQIGGRAAQGDTEHVAYSGDSSGYLALHISMGAERGSSDTNRWRNAARRRYTYLTLGVHERSSR